MSFSDPRAKLHPALTRDDGPYTYFVESWAHERDQLRIEREPWPFSWTIPAPAWHHMQENLETTGATVAWRHPLHPRRRAGYDLDLIIVDEISGAIGTHLHAEFERYYLRQEGW